MRAAGDVLVVDDDEATREMLLEVLEDEGYVVRGAFDAPSALAALADYLPALLLLDKRLPGGSESVLTWAHAHAPDLPVALITADGSADQSLENAGLIACLIKPFELNTLLDCVMQYVLPREQWLEAE